MEPREWFGRALRASALASILAAVFAGGLWVALELERDLAGPTDAAFKGKASDMYLFEDGGVGFSITTSCTFEPQFDPPAWILAPLVMLTTLRPPRLIELHLDSRR